MPWDYFLFQSLESFQGSMERAQELLKILTLLSFMPALNFSIDSQTAIHIPPSFPNFYPYGSLLKEIKANKGEPYGFFPSFNLPRQPISMSCPIFFLTTRLTPPPNKALTTDMNPSVSNRKSTALYRNWIKFQAL